MKKKTINAIGMASVILATVGTADRVIAQSTATASAQITVMVPQHLTLSGIGNFKNVGNDSLISNACVTTNSSQQAYRISVMNTSPQLQNVHLTSRTTAGTEYASNDVVPITASQNSNCNNNSNMQLKVDQSTNKNGIVQLKVRAE